MRVALVVMPFAGADRPSLAAGLFKALLRDRGIPCDCKYFNLTFAGLLGYEPYQRLSKFAYSHMLAGEWIFSQIYFGESFSSWESYSHEILDDPVWGVGKEYRDTIHRAAAVAPVFLRIAYESCDWSQYDLVGFTSTFEQTLSSLCLARMIRRSHPHIRIAFGGANFEGPMGSPYFEIFPEIDYISTGEADLSFPQLCENLAAGIDEVPPGILSRAGSSSEQRPQPVSLEDLPVPDYDEFFPAHARAFPGVGPTGVMLEASRGCWWGQKRHCTFCGLNGMTMTFRRKSWQRVARESSALEERYSPSYLIFADNILAMDYFSTLLPHWADGAGRAGKFFEIKSNLRREQVALLKRAGIAHVQSGIESLSDQTLELMDKGVSAAQNIALLRWCRELGVDAQWNLLFGFPGEDLDDYPRTHGIMQKLSHLPAPRTCGSIRVDRFSPNFERWQEKGFLEIRPLSGYRHVFPGDDEGLRSLAYYFEYRHPHSDRLQELARDVVDFGAVWLRRSDGGTNGVFEVRRHLDGGWVLRDTRFNREDAALRLTERDLLLLRLCDSPTTQKALFEQAGALSGCTERQIRETHDALLEKEALCEVGKKIIALPLFPNELREIPLSPTKEG
ncbi:MAG: RiPP maturation radical SAM C-methyltransferase [Acidobacteriota bacterium]